MFSSMSEIRSAFPQFFARDTMRFFKSKIESELYDGRFFITSEQFTDGNYREPRKYTIRIVTSSGISKVGEFNKISTIKEARERIKTLVRDGYGLEDEEELTQCIHCSAWIKPSYGEDSPAEHADHEGTREDPRAPGDYNNICDVCNYSLGLRGGMS